MARVIDPASNWIYLYDILPDIEVDYEHYAQSEREVINPALEELGYRFTGLWRTAEGDSFGPLSRKLHTDKGVVWYG